MYFLKYLIRFLITYSNLCLPSSSAFRNRVITVRMENNCLFSSITNLANSAKEKKIPNMIPSSSFSFQLTILREKDLSWCSLLRRPIYGRIHLPLKDRLSIKIVIKFFFGFSFEFFETW